MKGEWVSESVFAPNPLPEYIINNPNPKMKSVAKIT